MLNSYKILKTSTLGAFGRVYWQIFLILFLALLTNVLSAAQVGIYSIGKSIFSTMKPLAIFGLQSSAVRFIPEAREGDRNNLEEIITFLIIGVLSFSAIVTVIVFFNADSISTLLLGNKSNTYIVIAFAVPLIFASTSIVLWFIARSFENYIFEIISLYFITPTISAIILGVMYYYNAGLSEYIWMTVLIECSYLFQAIYLFRNKLGVRLRFRMPTRLIVKKILKFSFFITITGFLVQLLGHMPKLILASLNEMDDVAYFYVMLSIVAVVNIASGSIASVVEPMFSHSNQSNNKKKIQRGLYNYSVYFSILITGPILILISIFSNNLLGLFGQEYTKIQNGMEVFSLLFIFSVLSMPIKKMLIQTGRHRIELLNIGFDLTLVSVGCYFGYIYYELLGACVGYGLGMVLGLFNRWIQLHTFFQIKAMNRQNTRILLALLTLLIFSIFGKEIIEFNYVNLLAWELFGMILYFIYVFNWILSINEKDFFRVQYLKIKGLYDVR